MQVLEFIEPDPEPLDHRGRNLQGPPPQLQTRFREFDVGGPLVGGRLRERVINPSVSRRLSIGDRVAESSCRDAAISLTDNGRSFLSAR